MRTRRSPRNQQILWRALGKQGARSEDFTARLVALAKQAKEELESIHHQAYPDCAGGCPAEEIIRELQEAIEQAEASPARRCYDCISYPKGGKARGECVLAEQIVNGRSKNRPCFRRASE